MKRRLLPLLLALGLLLSACSGGGRDPALETDPEHSFSPGEVTPEPEPTPTPTPTPVATPTPEPTPTPYNGPVSPLGGMPRGEEGVQQQPGAVVFTTL